jgi:orotidine-5'-phosphate decarboxylase
MTREELFAQIQDKGSFLCVGLDTDIRKIPTHLLSGEDPVFAFNKAIIDATLPYAVAYKPNLAFYESRGLEGWRSLERTLEYLRNIEPRPFIIADAKRGDIGNTSEMYARAFFEHLGADALTLAPYMGEDSVSPFLKFPGKWAVILALTSNAGASDFQLLRPGKKDRRRIFGTGERKKRELYEYVIQQSQAWGSADNIMYVVGATKAESLKGIRKLIPDHFLLVPGVGSQGGSLAEVAKYGLNNQCGLLVNASRSILYASSSEDFAQKAAEEARLLAEEMKSLMTGG